MAQHLAARTEAVDAPIVEPPTRGRPTPVGPVDARRVTIATVGLAIAAYGLMVLVRLLPHGVAADVAAFVAGLVVIPLVASPAEWFVHRFVYHEPKVRPLAAIFTVHTAHHYAYFPTWRYVTGGPARRLAIRRRAAEAHLSPVRNAGVRLAHFTWYMAIGTVLVFLPAWAITHDGVFFAGQLVSCIVVSNLFIVVHDTIHRPGSHRIVEAQPWFAFLDNHHFVHHVSLGANLNFLLPLADLCFGTLRTTMTDEEVAAHGTLEDAKRAPVGTGERARTAT
jgi:hypothetical protein